MHLFFQITSSQFNFAFLKRGASIKNQIDILFLSREIKAQACMPGKAATTLIKLSFFYI